MKNIYIFGSLNTDLVIRSGYMPVSGETMHGQGFEINFGGKGANQAAAAGKLGANVYMGGLVGNDSFGADMINNLKNQGVNVDNVRVVEGSSGVAVIIVIDGDNRIILDGGANAKVTINDVEKLLETAKAGDIFMTQLENPIDVIGDALKLAKERGLYVILNPAPANKDIAKYCEYVDLIIPNESESRLLTGESDYVKSAEKLPCKEVIVTLGGKGQYYHSADKKFVSNCKSVKVVDTTAAGDTFCGALAYQLSLGVEIETAMQFAGSAASLACTKRGAQQSIPNLEDVNNFIKN